VKALILAAGYATRLYPLTKEYPKPLLQVNRKPIINYIIEKLNAIKQIDEIIVVTNHKFIPQFRNWKKHLKINKRLSLVDDQTADNQTRLGAIGDMHFAIAKKRITDDLLVVGADNIFDSSLDDFIYFSRKSKAAAVIGIYDIKRKNSAVKYGVVSLDKENKVIDFQEKPVKPKTSLVAMCLYYFPGRSLKLIKEYLKKRAHENDAAGLYIGWLTRKTAVHGFVMDGHWYDIGDFKFYNKAKKTFATAGIKDKLSA
jgi:glucose-1-phosphate thymidylyltransferase